MDHNNFDFDDDFIQPLIEFFKQTHQLAGGNSRRNENTFSNSIKFSDEYYFPSASIVSYEKKLIKNSIIWDIIEDRQRQANLKKS